MALLTKIQILEMRNRLKCRVIETPEWGGTVIITELTGTQRDGFEADLVGQPKSNGSREFNFVNARAKLCAKCIVNPDDYDAVNVEGVVTAVLKQGHSPTRMFLDNEARELGMLSASALDRVFTACQELSGITKADVDELVGELKNDQSANSGLN